MCSASPSDPENASLENYPIHTVTGLVKRWLRELPDPLMTFSLYNDFLHAVGEKMFLSIDSSLIFNVALHTCISVEL